MSAVDDIRARHRIQSEDEEAGKTLVTTNHAGCRSLWIRDVGDLLKQIDDLEATTINVYRPTCPWDEGWPVEATSPSMVSSEPEPSSEPVWPGEP